MTTATTQLLSREQILQSELLTDIVEVPEWGGSVRVRELSASEIDRLGFAVITKDGKANYQGARGSAINIASWCCIDENGESLFSKDDVKELQRKSNRAVRRIVDRVREMSNVGENERPWSLPCPHCEKEFEVDLTALLAEYDEAQGDDPKN